MSNGAFQRMKINKIRRLKHQEHIVFDIPSEENLTPDLVYKFSTYNKPLLSLGNKK